jgi:hypothetical protein
MDFGVASRIQRVSPGDELCIVTLKKLKRIKHKLMKKYMYIGQKSKYAAENAAMN